MPPGVLFVEGDVGDEALVGRILSEHRIDAILHFAGSIVVPDSIADPLGYYFNNTVKSRSLLAAAVAHGVQNFIFSSTAAVYGTPREVPIAEDAPLQPISPYGASKLMTERMLADTAAAFPLRYLRPALFQCRRRGCREPVRPGDAESDPSHQGRERGRDGQAGASGRVRRRLSDGGRHLRPGLYPRHGSGARALACAAVPARRRRQSRAELRLWARLFDSPGDRNRQAGVGRRISRCAWRRSERAIRRSWSRTRG